MEKHLITQKLTLIFREVFGDSSLDLRDDLTASDVENWGSLTHMLMISEVEKQFGIKFKWKDLNRMNSVGDLISIICSKYEKTEGE